MKNFLLRRLPNLVILLSAGWLVYLFSQSKVALELLSFNWRWVPMVLILLMGIIGIAQLQQSYSRLYIVGAHNHNLRFMRGLALFCGVGYLYAVSTAAGAYNLPALAISGIHLSAVLLLPFGFRLMRPYFEWQDKHE
jgi:hypothetical protein